MLKSIDNQNMTDFSIFMRQEIAQEKMLILDFSYLAGFIDGWWRKESQDEDLQLLIVRCMNLMLKKASPQHIAIFSMVGLNNSKIAAVCIKNIFTIDSPKLSLVVHEALSELFHVSDIKYVYEEHKTLYLKPGAEVYKDWGSGYGEIAPHSDDLYESLNIDYLSLTVCRDVTKTATTCFFPKVFLQDFDDEELFQLKTMRAKFKSGKNVDVLIERERNVLEYSEKFGFRFFLDFRVDNLTGQRMIACLPKDQILLDKMSAKINNCHFESSIPETGTFFIVANHKVLHSRARMNMDKLVAKKISLEGNLSNTPRLLYRSKGPRKEYLNLTN